MLINWIWSWEVPYFQTNPVRGRDKTQQPKPDGAFIVLYRFQNQWIWVKNGMVDEHWSCFRIRDWGKDPMQHGLHDFATDLEAKCEAWQQRNIAAAGACAGGPLLLQLSAPDSANSSPFFSLHSGSCRMQRRFGVGSVEASCVFHPINVH